MTQDDQRVRADLFRSLHVQGTPLVLFNIWDAGSANAVAVAGAAALATGSWSVAQAHGYDDGEALPLDLAMANLARITAATALPVTVDLERGYGETAEEVARTIDRAIDAGAIGCNIEDGTAQGVREPGEQARRLAAARAASEGAGIPIFVNARTDLFLGTPTDAHASLVPDALARAQAYADAGADGLFVPGVVDLDLVAAIVAGSPLPVNVMMSHKTATSSDLAGVGIARISYGPGPYRLVIMELEKLAREAGTRPS